MLEGSICVTPFDRVVPVLALLGDEESTLSDDLRNGAVVHRHDGQARCHRFERWQSLALVSREVDEASASLEELGQAGIIDTPESFGAAQFGLRGGKV